MTGNDGGSLSSNNKCRRHPIICNILMYFKTEHRNECMYFRMAICNKIINKAMLSVSCGCTKTLNPRHINYKSNGGHMIFFNLLHIDTINLCALNYGIEVAHTHNVP